VDRAGVSFLEPQANCRLQLGSLPRFRRKLQRLPAGVARSYICHLKKPTPILLF
jgi:hypothetical protein